MAFILEDGIGVPEADAYVDIPYVESYLMGGRLAQFSELSEEDKKAAIILATQLVDISYEWIGNRKTAEQGLSWPRTDVELDGFLVEFPSALKKATCEAVYLSLTEESLFRTDNDKEVSSERIEGAVSVSYFNPKDIANGNQTRFEILDKLLRGLYRIEEKSIGGSSVGASKVDRV